MEKILSVCFSFFCHIVLSLLSKMTFISSLVAQRQLLIFPRSLSTFNSPFCYLANSYIYVINLNYFQLHYILSSPSISSPSISSLSSTRSPSLVPPSLTPPHLARTLLPNKSLFCFHALFVCDTLNFEFFCLILGGGFFFIGARTHY